MIVFTFANSVPTTRYSEALAKRTELIRQAIAKYTSSDLANSIPSVAVDNKNLTTPNGEKWLGELYTKVFTQVSKQGALSFFLATADFVRPRRVEEKQQEYKSSISRKPQPYRFVRDNNFNGGFAEQPRLINKSYQQEHRVAQNYQNRYEYSSYERPRIELNERQKVEIRKTINANVIPALAGTGAAIGAVGGLVGSAIGGTIGAVIGAIAWFWNR